MPENKADPKETFRKISTRILLQSHADSIKDIKAMIVEADALEAQRSDLMKKISEALAAFPASDPKFSDTLGRIVDAAIKMGDGAAMPEMKAPADRPAPKRASRIRFERDAAGRVVAAIPED